MPLEWAAGGVTGDEPPSEHPWSDMGAFAGEVGGGMTIGAVLSFLVVVGVRPFAPLDPVNPAVWASYGALLGGSFVVFFKLFETLAGA